MKHLKDQMRKAVSNHIREARSDATEGKMFSKNFICLCMFRLNIKYIDFNFNIYVINYKRISKSLPAIISIIL